MSFSIVEHVKQLPLEGTDNQIKWARTIRGQKALEIEKMSVADRAKLIRPHVTDYEFTTLGCNSIKRCGIIVSTICVHALSNPMAAWWIEKRSHKAELWIAEASKSAVAHYLKNPINWPEDDSPPWKT